MSYSADGYTCCGGGLVCGVRCRAPDVAHHATRGACKEAWSYLTGAVKGLVMLPLLLPLYVLGTLLVNVLALPLWLDHAFTTLYFTRLLGPTLKSLFGLILVPLVLAYVALSTAASALFALVFTLTYPGYVTIETKRQTAWRHTLLWSGWRETVATSLENVETYFHTATKGVPDFLRTVRRRAWPTRYEVYPLDWVWLAIVSLVGGALAGAAMAAILAVKLPFIALRALVNHVYEASLWWRSSIGPALGLAWVLGFGVLPTLAALAVPAALVWGLVVAQQSALMVLTLRQERGAAAWPAAAEPLAHLWAAVMSLNRESTRYILRQDVPFLPPSKTPLSLPWALAGLLPALLSLVCTAPSVLIIILMNLLPVVIAACGKVLHAASTPQGSRPYVFPFLLILLVLVVPLAPVGLALLLVVAVLDGLVYSVAVTHNKRSVVEGLKYALAVTYIYEYKVNKFALAQDAYELVHWASVLPRTLGVWAMPYMDPSEWDAGGPAHPMGIVMKQPRFVPPGLRRPRLDAEGRIVDMTGAAYALPSTAVMPKPSITLCAADGSLRPPIPVVDLLPLPLGYSGPSEGAGAGKDALNESYNEGGDPLPLYGVEMLPEAYRHALSEMVAEAFVLARAKAPPAAALVNASLSPHRTQHGHGHHGFNAQATAAAAAAASAAMAELFDPRREEEMPLSLLGMTEEDGVELERMARSLGLHFALAGHHAHAGLQAARGTLADGLARLHSHLRSTKNAHGLPPPTPAHGHTHGHTHGHAHGHSRHGAAGAPLSGTRRALSSPSGSTTAAGSSSSAGAVAIDVGAGTGAGGASAATTEPGSPAGGRSGSGSANPSPISEREDENAEEGEGGDGAAGRSRGAGEGEGAGEEEDDYDEEEELAQAEAAARVQLGEEGLALDADEIAAQRAGVAAAQKDFAAQPYFLCCACRHDGYEDDEDPQEAAMRAVEGAAAAGEARRAAAEQAAAEAAAAAAATAAVAASSSPMRAVTGALPSPGGGGGAAAASPGAAAGARPPAVSLPRSAARASTRLSGRGLSGGGGGGGAAASSLLLESMAGPQHVSTRAPSDAGAGGASASTTTTTVGGFSTEAGVALSLTGEVMITAAALRARGSARERLRAGGTSKGGGAGAAAATSPEAAKAASAAVAGAAKPAAADADATARADAVAVAVAAPGAAPAAGAEAGAPLLAPAPAPTTAAAGADVAVAVGADGAAAPASAPALAPLLNAGGVGTLFPLAEVLAEDAASPLSPPAETPVPAPTAAPAAAAAAPPSLAAPPPPAPAPLDADAAAAAAAVQRASEALSAAAVAAEAARSVRAARAAMAATASASAEASAAAAAAAAAARPAEQQIVIDADEDAEGAIDGAGAGGAAAASAAPPATAAPAPAAALSSYSAGGASSSAAGGGDGDLAERDDEDDDDGGEGGDEEDEDEDDEPFVLHPVTRPELPDRWVSVPVNDGSGRNYFVNFARNQTSWRLPA